MFDMGEQTQYLLHNAVCSDCTTLILIQFDNRSCKIGNQTPPLLQTALTNGTETCEQQTFGARLTRYSGIQHLLPQTRASIPVTIMCQYTVVFPIPL